MYIISACLAGVNCRYDGKDNLIKNIHDLVKQGKAILVCPEQLGGLPTPRDPSEITMSESSEAKVVSNKGEDVTREFSKGANETLRIAKDVDAQVAILKARSPSCGYGSIYDGSFSGSLIEGDGITARLLTDNGIKVFTEDDLPQNQSVEDFLRKAVKKRDEMEM